VDIVEDEAIQLALTEIMAGIMEYGGVAHLSSMRFAMQKQLEYHKS
jgi:hypothetical protein